MRTQPICLLHSIDDADHFIATHGTEHGYRLISTHCSVVDRLAALRQPCLELSAHITHEDNVGLMQAHWPGGPLRRETQELLAALDRCVPADVQALLQLRKPLHLFTALYDYMLSIAVTGKTLFSLSLDRLLTADPAKEMLVYEQQDLRPPYFSARDLLEEHLAQKHGIALRFAKSPGKESVATLPMRPVPARISTYARAAARRLSALLHKRTGQARQPLPHGCKRLLLFPEADLQNVPSLPLPFEVLAWSPENLVALTNADPQALHAMISPVVARIVEALGSNRPAHAAPAFLDRIKDHFAQQGEELLTWLVLLDRALEQKRIAAAAWGFSPGSCPWKNLLVNHMLAWGLPVAGMQHGGNYGTQDCGYMHVLSDYSKCTRFFSYGFTRADMHRELDRAATCHIVPVGHNLSARHTGVDAYKPRRGRVVYPPFFGGNQLVVADLCPPAKLAADQLLLLRALEDRTDLEVWIKPHPNASPRTFSCPETLSQLQHARIAGGGFTWFLTQMRPQLVVIDFPSSTLFESLPFDVDIFLLLDPVYRFSAEAGRMLSERAHVFSTAAEMAQSLRRYGHAPMPRLRSPEYFERFIHQPGTQERLARALTDWSLTWGEAKPTDSPGAGTGADA